MQMLAEALRRRRADEANRRLREKLESQMPADLLQAREIATPAPAPFVVPAVPVITPPPPFIPALPAQPQFPTRSAGSLSVFRNNAVRLLVSAALRLRSAAQI